MPENLVARWAHTAAQSPTAIALIDGATGRRWTRAELAAAISGQFAILPARRQLAGRPVVLAGRNSPDWLAMFVALLEAQAIPVAVDAGEPLDAQTAVARHLGAAAVWRGSTLEPIATAPRRRRNGLCLYKLTSGTTGEPRALPFTHAQMIADGTQICASMGISPADTNFAVIPLGHSYGLGNLVLPLLLQGTAIAIGSGSLPHVIADEVARTGATVFPAVPALLQMLTRADVDAAAFARLRLVLSAGAPLAPDTAQKFEAKFGRRVHGFYGSSETGGICFDRSGDATRSGRSVGTPLDGVRLDFRRGGRFVVASAAVMRTGAHTPPDLGERNEHGELVLLGRRGRTVKVAGRRVDLAEIERALRSVPGVDEAWAGADPKKTDAVAAVVASTLAPPKLRAALATRIAAWKIPDHLLVVADFPLTARGKPDRRKLRALLSRDPGA